MKGIDIINKNDFMYILVVISTINVVIFYYIWYKLFLKDIQRLIIVMSYKFRIIFILFLILPFVNCIFGQSKTIDSLLTAIKLTKEDTNKVILLNYLTEQYKIAGDFEKGLENSLLNTKLAHKLNYKTGESRAYILIGDLYYEQNNYINALKNYELAIDVLKIANQKKAIALLYDQIGIIYDDLGNFPLALKNHFLSLKINEELIDKHGIAVCYGNIGNVYSQQANFKEAISCYTKALNYFKELKLPRGIAYTYTNIGSIYFDQNKLIQALENYKSALSICESINDKFGISDSYLGIGVVYENQAKYQEAIDMYLKSLKIKEDIIDREGIASCYLNIGESYVKLHKLTEAEINLKKALRLNTELKNRDGIKHSYFNLAILDSALGNYKASYDDYKLYINYRDSLINEESERKSLEISMQYEFDKKEIAAKAAQEKVNAINLEEKQKQEVIILLVIGFVLLLIVFSAFLYNRFKVTQKQKRIIEEQKILVDNAYTTLHEKNKEVLDSIHYAKRIQRALITSEKYIETKLNYLIKK